MGARPELRDETAAGRLTGRLRRAWRKGAGGAAWAMVARRGAGMLTAGQERQAATTGNGAKLVFGGRGAGGAADGVPVDARQRELDTVMDAKERRKVPAFVRILALMCVRQSMLETLHRGLTPVTRTGDYSDVVVIDAEGQRIPWPEVSRFDENEMRDLMREIVNKLYTFFIKAEDPDFRAWANFVRPQSYHWDRPKIDKVLMHYVKEYARVRAKKG